MSKKILDKISKAWSKLTVNTQIMIVQHILFIIVFFGINDFKIRFGLSLFNGFSMYFWGKRSGDEKK